MNYSNFGLCFALFASLATLVRSKTNSSDVAALNVMFTSLNSPKQLKGWQASGGDPCGDSWEGIQCSGSSVTEINLAGLGLTGTMGYQLSSLKSVTNFDLSNNKIKGDIPYQLPPNAQYIDLSNNDFTNNIPYSFSQMPELEYLNLGNNQLNGQLNDMFEKLTKLKELDLSQNALTGNLPQSFAKLTSLKKLRLQDNKFTGPINVLANIPLDELNIENNDFSGWIPNKLKGIKKVKSGGNSWSSGPGPPSSGDESSNDEAKPAAMKSVVTGLTIAGIALGVLLLLVIIISLVSRRKSKHASHFFDEERFSQRKSFSRASQELSKELRPDMAHDYRDLRSSSFGVKHSGLLSSGQHSGLLSSGKHSGMLSSGKQSFSEAEFVNRLTAGRSLPNHAAPFLLADLQSATANFASGRLIGHGTIGRVYRAKYPDNKVLAVKKIDSSLFKGGRPDEFADIVANISKLHHPNIAELVGYCSEQGHNMLVQEYFRNGSLHGFLHMSDEYSRPLTWNTRVRIALGTARAVEYLHEVCSPPLLHKNIKSPNILLDAELNPHLSDCGLGIFYQRTSQNLGVGYNAPECASQAVYTQKSDVYSFGVVMLELLTGRKPFDSSKPKAEQCLVVWATPQLHDIEALETMADPALRGLYPQKSVARFADIISLCVQKEPEFRPAMSEVVQQLVRLVQRTSMNQRGDLGVSRQLDEYDH